MKKTIATIAIALISSTANAYASDTWLLCSYENLRGKTNIEKIVISDSKTIGLTYGTVSANNGEITSNGDLMFSDITKVKNGFLFTIETSIGKTTYFVSQDFTNFSMTNSLGVNGVSTGDPTTFSGTCKKD